MANNPFDQFDTQNAAPQPAASQPVASTQTNNPFDQFDTGTTPQQNTQVGAPQAQSPSSFDTFMAGVDGMNRQFEKLAIGTLQIGNSVSGLLGNPDAAKTQQDLSNLNKYGDGYGTVLGSEGADKSFAEHPYAYGTGAVVGTVAQGLGGSTIAKGLTGLTGSTIAPSVALANNPILRGGAQGILGGEVYGALQPADNTGDRLENIVKGGVLGAITGAAIPAIGAGYNTLTKPTVSSPYVTSPIERIVTPNQAAIKETAAKADSFYKNNPEVGTLDDALKDFDVLKTGYSTPGKVTGDAQLIGAEDSMALGPVGKDLVAKGPGQVEKNIQQRLTDTIKNMASEDVEQFVKQTKPQLADINISDTATNQLLKDPNIANTLNKFAPNTEVGTLGNNSVLKLSEARKDIQEKLFNDTFAAGDAGKMTSNTRESLTNSYRALNKVIDNDVMGTANEGVYSAYRQAAQKVAIKNNYFNELEKLKSMGDETGNAAYQIKKVNSLLFSNDKKINQFLGDIETVGGDIKSARALINVSDKLSKAASTEAIMKKNPNTTKMFGEGVTGGIQGFLNWAVNRNYDKALLELSTGGKWAPLIKEQIIKQNNPTAKMNGFMKLLMKAGKPAGTVGKAVLGPVSGAVLSQEPNQQ